MRSGTAVPAVSVADKILNYFMGISVLQDRSAYNSPDISSNHRVFTFLRVASQDATFHGS